MKFEVELDDDEIQSDLVNGDEQNVATMIRKMLEERFMTVKVRGKNGVVSTSETGMRLRRRGIFGYMFG